jgi:hypothetical protein
MKWLHVATFFISKKNAVLVQINLTALMDSETTGTSNLQFNYQCVCRPTTTKAELLCSAISQLCNEFTNIFQFRVGKEFCPIQWCRAILNICVLKILLSHYENWMEIKHYYWEQIRYDIKIGTKIFQLIFELPE